MITALPPVPATANVLQNFLFLKEDELIYGLKAGRLQAFSYLYKMYASSLLGIVRQLVRSQVAAEDVLQEVFIKISNHIGTYDEKRSRLFTWMARIAKNTAVDYLRCLGHLNGKKTEELDEISEAHYSHYSASYNVEVIGIRKLTQELHPDQQQVLELIYFQGYSHTEAAEKLNIPLGTIKTRLRSSILKLRKRFN